MTLAQESTIGSFFMFDGARFVWDGAQWSGGATAESFRKARTMYTEQTAAAVIDAETREARSAKAGARAMPSHAKAGSGRSWSKHWRKRAVRKARGFRSAHT